MDSLEQRIKTIEERNKKVEVDKAWEISLSRKALLMIFTFLAIGLYMRAIGIDKWYLNAIIPSLGFMLSTLSLPVFKRMWLKYIYKQNETK